MSPSRSSGLRILAGLLLVASLGGCQSPGEKLRLQGIQAFDRGEYPQALEALDGSLRYDPFQAQSNFYAGKAHLAQNHFQQAEFHLKLAWQADPSLPQVKEALVEALLKEGKADQALDFIERDAALTALTRNPKDITKIQYNSQLQPIRERLFQGQVIDRIRVAKTYEQSGDLDNAKANYLKALEMAPRSAQVLFENGAFEERIGDRAAARELFHRATAIDAKYPGLAEALARVE